MPPKSAKSGSAKSKGKGKAGKGKGKGKRASTGKKKGKSDEPEAPPPLVWPWQTELAWMNKDLRERAAARRSFREFYLHSDGIMMNESEWKAALRSHTQPFVDTRAEAGVQMLVTVLAEPPTRKDVGDDCRALAAALRARHIEQHFQRMIKMLESYLSLLSREGVPAPPADVIDWFVSPPDAMSRPAAESHLHSLGLQYRPAPAPAEGGDGSDDDDDDDDDLPKPPPLDALAGPIQIFSRFLKENKLRLVEVFRELDADQRGLLSHEQLHRGLQTAHVPLAADQLSTLIAGLTSNRDAINYANFCESEALLNPPPPSIMINDAAVPSVPLGPFLAFTFEEFGDLVLHTHYATRP